MNTLESATLSPTEVLEVFRDSIRHEWESDPEENPDCDLDFETKIAMWREDGDLLPCDQLVQPFNQYWNMDISLQEWRSLLTPEKQKTVRGVCELISRCSTIENVRVPVMFGRPCRPAGVFFAVRELLKRDGADVSNISPSSPIRPYAMDHPGVFVSHISRLAPNHLPAIRMEHPSDRWNCLFAVSLIMLALCSTISVLCIPMAVISAILFIAQYVTALQKPTDVRFGALETFRDLCECLAPGIRTNDTVC